MKESEFSENTGGTEEESAIRCKKCHFIVAKKSNVLDHDVGIEQNADDWRRRSMVGNAFFGGFSGGNQEEETSSVEPCSSVFLEPMSWMKGISEGKLDGELHCQQCEAKLGTFNWIGEPCSCGCTVAPAFVMLKSEVDYLESK